MPSVLTLTAFLLRRKGWGEGGLLNLGPSRHYHGLIREGGLLERGLIKAFMVLIYQI